MSEMVERAVKAICESSDFCWLCEDAGADDDRTKHVAEAVARIVIAALREPTPDMRIAGGIAWSNALPSAETYVDSADAGWKAMIDEALK